MNVQGQVTNEYNGGYKCGQIINECNKDKLQMDVMRKGYKGV